MRLCERDDHAVERIAVEQRQGGRRTRDAGIERDFPQVIPLGQPEKPRGRWLLELKLPPCRLDRHFPRGDDRYKRLRRLPQCARGAPWQVPVGQRQQGARIEEHVHRNGSGHSSSVRGSLGRTPGANSTRKRGAGERLRAARRLTRRRISATSRPSRQSTTVSFRSSTALTSSESRVFASCMLTVIILANLAKMETS